MDKAAGKFVQSLSQDTATLGHEETQFEERILKERLNLGLKVANSACEQVRGLSSLHIWRKIQTSGFVSNMHTVRLRKNCCVSLNN